MKKTFLFIALAACFISCDKYLTKSESQSNRLNEAYFTVKAMYQEMVRGERDYKDHEPQYVSVAASLDTLYAEDKKRNSASALCRQDELLIKGWAMRQGYHKGKGTLTAKEANIERQIMDGYFKSRIDSENAIK